MHSSSSLKKMISLKKSLFVFAIFQFLICTSFAQSKHAYWNDVQIIKNYDKLYKPPVRPILFVGSSSIRKWDDLQEVFGSYKVLNRGIGGAVVNDIIYYLDDLVFAYQPRQIVMYVGENDVPAQDETADTILNRTIRLFHLIRAKLPEVPIIYISLKPSPSREKYIQKTIETNRLIKNFVSKEKNAVFVDIFSPMVTKDGKTRPELFVSDMLHMNPQGYAIWEKAVKPYLKKENK